MCTRTRDATVDTAPQAEEQTGGLYTGGVAQRGVWRGSVLRDGSPLASLAREQARERGVKNVQFRLGEIEHLPVPPPPPPSAFPSLPPLPLPLMRM